MVPRPRPERSEEVVLDCTPIASFNVVTFNVKRSEMEPFRLTAATTLAVLLTIAGCSMTPSMPTPEAEQDLPGRFKAAPGDTTLPAAAADTAAYDATRWWTVYDDPALTALVDTALAANLDLKVAQSRVEELAAQFRIARAPLFPSVSADGQAS